VCDGFPDHEAVAVDSSFTPTARISRALPVSPV